MRNVTIKIVTDADSGIEAIQLADIYGGKPITVGGRYLVVTEAEADRLAADRVPFAFLGWCNAIDRIVTVPVN
jgi:hypothetical protein